MSALQIDRGDLARFEEGLNPRTPETSVIPARIIGYGEISTIFEIGLPTLEGYACKRMPIFRTSHEMDHYEALYREYNRLLEEDIGIAVPASTSVRVMPRKGNMVVYAIQRKLPSASICNAVIRRLDDESAIALVLRILAETEHVWRFNASGGPVTIGFDGQISNWALRGYGGGEPPAIGSGTELFYFDTSTPLITRHGIEELNPDLFLRSAPSFLLWLIKWFFLEGVMTRYYDPHLITVDLIANFYKEQRPDLIPALVESANNFFAADARALAVRPVTVKEVAAYYREDALIWRLFLALRKFDRFLHERVLHKPYVFILPGTIRR